MCSAISCRALKGYTQGERKESGRASESAFREFLISALTIFPFAGRAPVAPPSRSKLIAVAQNSRMPTSLFLTWPVKATETSRDTTPFCCRSHKVEFEVSLQGDNGFATVSSLGRVDP